MADVWVCTSPIQPEFAFYFASDQSGGPFLFDCQRVEHTPPGAGITSWFRFSKILQLLEHLPPP